MNADEIQTGRTNHLSSGETLDGEGATIRTNSFDQPLIEVPDGGTVKNLTLIGPWYDEVVKNGWWDYEVSGEAWKTAASGIKVVGSNVTIENVTLSGWSFGGVIVGDLGGSTHRNVVIRDCTLWDNNCRGLGYGVAVYSGIPVIEWCEFQNNRHDISQGGKPNAGYEARYNHVGDTGRIYGFEAHGPESARIHVHHNTFEDKQGNYPPKGTGRRVLIRNRGVPVDQCLVEHNWFKGEMTVKMNSESRSMYTFQNNHEAPSQPPEGVGIPDEGDGGEIDYKRSARLLRLLRETSLTLKEIRKTLS